MSHHSLSLPRTPSGKSDIPYEKSGVGGPLNRNGFDGKDGKDKSGATGKAGKPGGEAESGKHLTVELNVHNPIVPHAHPSTSNVVVKATDEEQVFFSEAAALNMIYLNATGGQGGGGGRGATGVTGRAGKDSSHGNGERPPHSGTGL